MATLMATEELQLDEARLAKGPRGPELIIPLPTNVNAAALPALGKSLGRALQVIARDGTNALIARADAVASAAIPIAEPSQELLDERLAQRRTLRRIVTETKWLSAEQIRRQLGKRVAPTADWKRRGKIFGVIIGEQEFFAAWQFGDDTKPLPIVAEVLKVLGPIADPWKIAAWFHFPNSWLAAPSRAQGKPISRAPKDCLNERDALLRAAARRNASYVA